MIEVGRVTEVKGRRALVEIKPTPLCGDCQKRSGCAIFQDGIKVIEAHNIVGAKTGQVVKVAFQPWEELLSAVLLFGLPVLFLLLGVILGLATRLPVFFGLCGLFISLLILRLINNLINKKGALLPKIVAPADAEVGGPGTER